MDEEELVYAMSEMIYERSRMARGDADDLAWDLLHLAKENL